MHWLAHYLGLDDGGGGWYLWWSGFVGDLALFGAVLMALRKLNCGVKWCPRIGRHEYEMENGVKHNLCRKHHPHTDGPVTRQQVEEHHYRKQREKP